ncbi:hypothetical protein HPP92_023081 [Vanilla planifolia]|uniref:Uncharacterized protein n=1 Tax=Vanilla planifolia TaxID=51239 RepID=A0A835PQU2_VANPL|nr:hypothetical protein HPP92_023081 [Vanilla planifolia]
MNDKALSPRSRTSKETIRSLLFSPQWSNLDSMGQIGLAGRHESSSQSRLHKLTWVERIE